MGNIFIERLKVKGFGCLENIDVSLTPLHALIGPNDSGKSTILRAVQTILEFAARDVSNKDENPWIDHFKFEREIRFDSRKTTYRMIHENGYFEDQLIYDGEVKHAERQGAWANPPVLKNIDENSQFADIKQWLMGSARLVRWDTDSLRRPSKLIPDDEKIRLDGEHGSGLPGVYDAIMNRGDEAFGKISEDVRRLFPTIKHVRLKNVSDEKKALEVELKNSDRIPAMFMSDGLLYYLAFAAIRYLEPTSVLLVEEPENGLHPARIRDILGIMRDISTTTQVIIATHSPLVINELKGEEVTVVTRDPGRGTQTRLLCDTPNFKERSKVYALGELWVSYADGEEEKPLFAKSDSL